MHAACCLVFDGPNDAGVSDLPAFVPLLGPASTDLFLYSRMCIDWPAILPHPPCRRYIWPTSSYLVEGVLDRPPPTLLQVYLTGLSYLVEGVLDRPPPTLLQVYLTGLSYLVEGVLDRPLHTLLQVYLTVLLLVSCGS